MAKIQFHSLPLFEFQFQNNNNNNNNQLVPSTNTQILFFFTAELSGSMEPLQAGGRFLLHHSHNARLCSQ